MADDSAHITRSEALELSPDETFITVLNSVYRQSLGNSGTHDRANGGVHSWSISSAGDDRDPFHMTCFLAARKGPRPAPVMELARSISFSISRMRRVVLTTASGLRLIESMRCLTRYSANSGKSDGAWPHRPE